ncbi:DUF1810 domain-containing protein [Sphingosinicella sp. CPCC 101087]|uniref:DUF1810 domain-containing protein n=1 Tax=Sphingosinicella sp. CPCC 101087 TaxID=2497754 RepID=UPI00101D9765|nr:DUF1810 domain-containing protein [Sphingosinicella sp. CPCC 101087]
MGESADRDRFDLQRFVAAQEPIYWLVQAELARGCKESHWMWFVFPQIAGLGYSAAARNFALSGLEEARAYLSHAVLGSRLRECTEAVLAHRELTAEEIFGRIDAVKFRSSMTLFDAVEAPPSPFAEALDAFYGGQRDPATCERLAKS